MSQTPIRPRPLSINSNILNQKADQCVKCGLCLPHCPTYRLFENENESPRGRIALIQGMANQQIRASKKLQQHLDHCLSCRACERVCPSGVDYGYLLDHARHAIRQSTNQGPVKKFTTRLGLSLLTSKGGQKNLQNLLYVYQRSGMRSLLRISGLSRLLQIHQMDRILPTIKPFMSFKAGNAKGHSKGKVGIFTGCTGHLFDQQALQDSIYLLQQLGYEPVIPAQQTCCGALHQHQGDLSEASQLARQNMQAFEGVDTIIYIASGCGAQLQDYPGMTWDNTGQLEQANRFADKAQEICHFLLNEDMSPLQFSALNKTITVHTPCTMRNALRQDDASLKLLRYIPDIDIRFLAPDTGCCGAAGSYMLSQPRLARQIRKRTIDAIEHTSPDIVTTSNIGCRLHLAEGLNKKPQLAHPVSLLVQQMQQP